MSRSTETETSFARRVGLPVAGIAVAGLVVVAISRVIGGEAFSAATGRPDRLEPGIGIKLKDVQLRHYDGKRLVTQANVDEVEVRRDRQFFTLEGISRGVYVSPDGDVKFSALAGTWNSYNGVLEATQGVNVITDDFNLTSERLSFDQTNQSIDVPAPIKGSFFDGQVRAASLNYKLKGKRAVVGAISWSGDLAVPLQDGETAKPTKWSLDGERGFSEGDVFTYVNGQGTDGDILVKGQRIQHNRKTDVLTVSGRVEYYSPAANLIADKAVIYRKDKRAVLSGNVRMLVKPKDQQGSVPKVEEIPPFRPSVPDQIKATRPPAPSPQEKSQYDQLRDPKTARNYPMILIADEIDYYYRKGSRKATVTGKPQARQEMEKAAWRQAWAFKAIWDGEKDTVELLSTPEKIDVRLKNSAGDDIKAKTVLLKVEGEDVRDFEATSITGEIFPNEEDLPPKPEKGTSTGGATTGGSIAGSGGG